MRTHPNHYTLLGNLIPRIEEEVDCLPLCRIPPNEPQAVSKKTSTKLRSRSKCHRFQSRVKDGVSRFGECQLRQPIRSKTSRRLPARYPSELQYMQEVFRPVRETAEHPRICRIVTPFLRNLPVGILTLPPDPQRIIFLLENLEGSCQDIAAVLHITPPMTVIQIMTLPTKMHLNPLNSNAIQRIAWILVLQFPLSKRQSCMRLPLVHSFNPTHRQVSNLATNLSCSPSSSPRLTLILIAAYSTALNMALIPACSPAAPRVPKAAAPKPDQPP